MNLIGTDYKLVFDKNTEVLTIGKSHEKAP